MILNKEKIELIKALKKKNIKANKDKNKKENIYFQNILKNNSIKYEDNNPEMKNINENMKNIFRADESKKKALKYIFRNNKNEKKENDLNEFSQSKIVDNNQIQITLTEPENNIIFLKDSINQIKYNNKKKSNKIEYHNNGYKTPLNNFRKNKNEYRNNSIEDKTKNNYYSINYEKENYNEENIIDNKLYKVIKKLKIPKPLNMRQKSSNILDNDKILNKNINSFYIPQKPTVFSINDGRNNLNKENLTNDLSDFNEAQTMIYQDNNNIGYLNKYNNKTTDKRNFNRNNYIRRRNNKIRIIDSSKAIKEFNISFPDDDYNEDYLYNNSSENTFNFRTLNNEHIYKNKLYENYNKYYYMKNIPSININQFNINASNSNDSIQNNKYNNDYLTERNERTNNRKNDNLYSNDIFKKKNFDININNNILINDNLKFIEGKRNIKGFKKNDKLNDFKVLVKKRPLNEMKIKNISYKKFQNLKYIQEKEKEKEKEKENKFDQSNINKNNKFDSYIIERMSFLINSIINDKKKENIKENENIIIIKKKDGEILNKIYIEENIEKINEKLEKEKFTINNIPVKLIYNDENKDIKEELDKIKNENDLLNKKDKTKIDLINRLDKEKQKLSEEISRLNKEINKEKMKNEKIIKENEKIKEENIKINNILNDLMKEDKEKEEMFEIGNIGGINFNIDIESINDGQEKIEELVNKEENK